MSLYLTFLNLIHIGLIQAQGFGSSIPYSICWVGQFFSLGVALFLSHLFREKKKKKVSDRENWCSVEAKRSKGEYMPCLGYNFLLASLFSLVNVLLQFRALSSTLCSSCGRDKADKTCLSNTSVSFQLRMKYFYVEADWQASLDLLAWQPLHLFPLSCLAKKEYGYQLIYSEVFRFTKKG